MKILIINPNSSSEMTEAIDRTAKKFAAGEYEVITLPTQGAPMFIDSYQDKAAALPGMMNIVREYENDVDAFIIACHCDPMDKGVFLVKPNISGLFLLRKPCSHKLSFLPSVAQEWHFSAVFSGS